MSKRWERKNKSVSFDQSGDLIKDGIYDFMKRKIKKNHQQTSFNDVEKLE